MFRRIEHTIDPDPYYPADLTQLGFFINKIGQICMIDAPHKHYLFHSTNNERVNEVRNEAMQNCQRNEMEKRLAALGLGRIYLPSFSTTKPKGPHVPILAPSLKTLAKRKRVIVLINDTSQDPGVLAYRQLQRESGINGGSVINFVKELIKRSEVDNSAEQDEAIFQDGYTLNDDTTTPALLVMNTAQLLYSHKYNQAMTMRSWNAMPRKSIAHEQIKIHPQENRVLGHHDEKEHIKTVFSSILCDPSRVAPDAEVYVIAIESGTQNILGVLGEDFDKYGSRITAMALIECNIDDSQIRSPKLKALLRQRTRHWKNSAETSNPLHCTHLPEDYYQETTSTSPQQPFPDPSTNIMKSTNHICWYDDLPIPGPTSSITQALHSFTLIPLPPHASSSPSSSSSPDDWASGQAPLCPTFAGSYTSVPECVFTDPAVQNAILSFFEDVAQDPYHYRNPPLSVYNAVPQPTPDNPLSFSAAPEGTRTQELGSIGGGVGSVGGSANAGEPVPTQQTPSQLALAAAQTTYHSLCAALLHIPDDDPALQPGRELLTRKIEKHRLEVQDLQKKVLSHGGLGAGEGEEIRQKWVRKEEGPKVRFAGTMVDRELLRMAGLGEVADGEGGGEVKEEEEEEEEKAFV